MQDIIVHSDAPVTLVGGGELETKTLLQALQLAPRLVAADGGATAALDAGHIPEAVIGDMDSLRPEDRARLDAGSIHQIDEQDRHRF